MPTRGALFKQSIVQCVFDPSALPQKAYQETGRPFLLSDDRHFSLISIVRRKPCAVSRGLSLLDLGLSWVILYLTIFFGETSLGGRSFLGTDMDVIDNAKLKWPLVYTMFCTMYLTQQDIKKNPTGSTNMLRLSYTGQEKAWYLFRTRAKELRAFLHGYGAKETSWAVNLFLRVLDVRGLKQATQELFKPKNFEPVLCDVLQSALRMRTNKDYIVQQENILSKPHVSIFLNGEIVHQFALDKRDKSWMKLNNVFGALK